MQPTITSKPCASASRFSAKASVKPPVLSSLMFTTSYFPARCLRLARSWALSSAQTGTGLCRPSSASSSAAGKGCSTNLTPRRNRCGARSAYTSALQPSLASTMISGRGAPARTASRRGISSGVPSLIFSSGRWACSAACARMFSGLSSESV